MRFDAVQRLLRLGWSPQQVAGILHKAYPEDIGHRVSHETIYNAIYVLPRGELRTQLVACLRRDSRVRRDPAR